MEFHKVNIDANAGYWTAERISAHRDEWDIYVVYESNTIVSAIYSKLISNDCLEVFGAFSHSDTHPEMLLRYATMDVKHKYPKIECFMMMVDIGDKDFIKAAHDIGFEQKSRYCCWEKIL